MALPPSSIMWARFLANSSMLRGPSLLGSDGALSVSAGSATSNARRRDHRWILTMTAARRRPKPAVSQGCGAVAEGRRNLARPDLALVILAHYCSWQSIELAAISAARRKRPAPVPGAANREPMGGVGSR